MTNNFKEVFEDSQAYEQSQIVNQQNRSQENQQQGYPIQLAKINSQTKIIQLDDKALDIIAQYDMPVGFVSLVGRYRIGKSCLLNRILGLKGKGFGVSNTTRQCTKGIWMWSQPFFSVQNQCYLFFLDTEGTQALQKQTQIDIKLFTLNCLLSSYLIFNSIGNIDQRSIQQLNLVTHLTKSILISQDSQKRQNSQQLHLYMPKFMWLLRDFTLELKDQYNRKLSATQYLQNCLRSQSSYSDSQSNRIKNQIVNIFRDRTCLTLVRPVDEEFQLQKLNQLPDHALRLKFIQGVNVLKQTIFKKAQPKCYQGNPLYGDQVVSMFQNFVKSMNNGAIPKIKTAWEQIGQDQGIFAYNQALDKYNQIYSSQFTDDNPLNPTKLHQILTKLRVESIKQFQKNLSQPNKQFQTKLHKYLDQKQKSIIEVNKRLSQVKNVEILKDLSMPLLRKIQTGDYKGKKKNLSKDIDDIVKFYNQKASGQTKGDIISQFLTTLHPVIFSLAQEQDSKTNSKLSSDALEQFEKRQKLMEQQLNSLKTQVDSKDQLIKKKQKQLIQARQILKKKQSTTCCQVM